MSDHYIKEWFQEAFKAYIEQYREFIDEVKINKFLSSLEVKIDDVGMVYVNNIYLGIRAEDCDDVIDYFVDVELIDVYITYKKTITFWMNWEKNQGLPTIESIILKERMYSFNNE